MGFTGGRSIAVLGAGHMLPLRSTERNVPSPRSREDIRHVGALRHRGRSPGSSTRVVVSSGAGAAVGLEGQSEVALVREPQRELSQQLLSDVASRGAFKREPVPDGSGRCLAT